MDADIAGTTSAFYRTVRIRAKYLLEVHWALLFVVVTKEFAREPLFFQISKFILFHGIMQSYRTDNTEIF